MGRMADPDFVAPQVSSPSPETGPARPRGHGLLAAAIVVAGLGGGLLAWHPWDENTVQQPTKDPHRITVQKVGEQRESGNSDATRPVYCLTNETGGLYCLVMPDRYTIIEPETR